MDEITLKEILDSPDLLKGKKDISFSVPLWIPGRNEYHPLRLEHIVELRAEVARLTAELEVRTDERDHYAAACSRIDQALAKAREELMRVAPFLAAHGFPGYKFEEVKE